MMKIQYNATFFAIVYLVMPIIIFFLFWLHPYIGIPLSIALCSAAYIFLRNNYVVADEHIELDLSETKEAIVASLYVLVYLLLTGHGTIIGSAGFDTPWRNAMYYDLIQQSWPIIYEYSQSALVYYLTFWLVPAGISYILGLSGEGSNLVLVIWTYIGLRIFLSLLWSYLKLNKRQLIPITVFFLFWSGLNIIGMLLMSALNLAPLKIDTEWGWSSWWYTGISDSQYQMAYMIRTVFDSLGNTYNQFVPALLGIMLFLKYREINGLAFLGLLVVPYSPLSFMGLFILMLAEGMRQGYDSIRKGVLAKFCKNIISGSNVIAAFTIFPVFFFYFTANSMVTSGESTGMASSIFFAPLAAYGIVRIFVLSLYYILQFGIFMRLCYRHNQDKYLFWSICISLLLIPIFRVGKSGDFCWNASMPGFYIIMVFMMQEVLRLFKENRVTKHVCVVLIVITLASLTPCMQMVSGLRKCAANRTMLVNIDHAHVGETLSNKGYDTVKDGYGNFMNIDYKNKIFYRYIAKL